MTAQAGLCQTWSETPKTGFLASLLILSCNRNQREILFLLVECVQNRPRYFAKRLMKSMKGLGTDEETLIRIVASRSEVTLSVSDLWQDIDIIVVLSY